MPIFLWCVQCTLHKDIPFYVLFPFMCFKQRFMKVFIIFSWFEVWYISPLNTWKQQNLGFACIQGVKMLIFKSRKNREKSPFIFNPISILHDLLFWQKAWYYTMYKFQKCFFLNACNLGLSNAGAVATSSNQPAVNNYLQYNKDQVKCLAFINTY